MMPWAMTSTRAMPPKMLIKIAFTCGSEPIISSAFTTRGRVVHRADVEEVGRVAARELDRVHRRHGQAGAVDHAADVTVQLDEVGDAGFLRAHLGRVFLVDIAVVDDVGVFVLGVVVEVELGVQRRAACCPA